MTVVLPRLCLLSNNKGVLVSGHGPNIEWIEGGKICGRLRVFNQEGSHVFGLVSCHSNDALFVYGEKSIAYCSSSVQNGVLDKNYTRKFHDTILAVKVLSDNLIVILFMSNLCILYGCEVDEGKLNLTILRSVQSDHTATMLYGILLGDAWEDIAVISGTVFGEILYSEPANGSEIKKKLLGHTGMIFGLHVSENLLYSISDDRSLRVWPLDEIKNDGEQVAEIHSVFGHSARPFALCSSPDNHIYTAGIDQLVCKWKLNEEKKLVLVDQLSLSTGGVRSLKYFEEALWVGSETGALLEVTFASPSSNAAPPKSLKTCDDLRGFGYLKNTLYTVDGKGQLYKDGEAMYVGKCLRYINVSPPHCSNSILVAYEKNACVIISEDESTLLEFDEGNVVSAICSGSYIFIYNLNKQGKLYDKSGNLLQEFDVSSSITSLPKKVSFLPSAIGAFLSSDGKEHLLVGSTSGHIIHCCMGDNTDEFESLPEISRVCAKGQIMSIRDLGNRIAIYCKNGALNCWTFKNNKFLPSALPLIRGAPSLDWPCGSYFIGDQEYIAEFHSTDFRLLNRDTGLVVLTFLCGGGNRPWFFRLSEDSNGKVLGTLTFIRKETLVTVTAGIHFVNSVADSLHVSQIVSVQKLSSYGDSFVICTSGVDCQVTFSEVNSITQEVRVLDKIATADGITSICVLENASSQNEVTIVLGSSKGCVYTWLVTLDATVVKDLIVTGSYIHPDGTRVLDIMTRKINADLHECVAVLADGSIILLTVKETIDENIFALCSTIDPPDYSLYTRGQIIDDNFFWISTSGKLGQHKIRDNKLFESVNQIQAVKCGVSSVSVTPLNDEYICVIGDEAGVLTVYVVTSLKMERISTLSYHSATVTDVKVRVENNIAYIHSVSLDCRAAVHRVDLALSKRSFIKGKCLSIWDPARFIFSGNVLVAVGSGLEVLTL